MNTFYLKAFIQRGKKKGLVRIKPHQIPKLLNQQKTIFVCDESDVYILSRTAIICIAQFIIIKSIKESIDRYKEQYPELALWVEE